jgi:tetratricopeptide (TPR) repeat protein
VVPNSTDLWARFEEGVALASIGRASEAREALLRLWQDASDAGDDYAACAVAHMLGAMEPMSPEVKLAWHRASLERANRIRDGRVDDWYASIYLNLANAYRLLGQPAEALDNYQLARHHLHALDNSDYAAALGASIDHAMGKMENSTRSVTG